MHIMIIPKGGRVDRLFRLCGWMLDHAHASDTRWVEGAIAVRICSTCTETRREGDGPCASWNRFETFFIVG